MDRRYQVFISSTFTDLKDARREVSDALLKADCFPAGMELFPAADAEQFAFIKEVINQSDYYIVISAGKYGSIHHELGKSYTELEYDYALEQGKPIIRLLHKDPFGRLPGALLEESDTGRESLRAFRAKLTQGNLVNFWESPQELGQQVVLGLIDARKRKPAIGWARANQVSTVESELKIARLEARISELEEILLESASDIDLRRVFTRLNPVTLVVYENTHTAAERPFFDRDAECTYGTFLYRITENELSVSADFYAERILISLLYSRDIHDARKHAGAIVNPGTGIIERVALLNDEDTLEGIVLRLEAAGLVRQDGEGSDSLIDVIFRGRSAYLAGKRWHLSEAARSFAVRKAIAGKYLLVDTAR